MAAAIIPAVIAAAGAHIAGASLLVVAVSFATTLAMGAISHLMAPRPPSFDGFGDFASQARSRTQMLRQPITYRRYVAGEARLGGRLTFYETTGDNRYHHMALTLCDGPCTAIGTVWLDGEPVHPDQLDGSGNVIAGRYANKVRIKKHLGAADQAADSDLVAETSVTSAFRGRGVAYVYARVDWDQDTFPNGLPDVAAWVRGPAVRDPRDDADKWTPNAALHLRNYLANDDYGRGAAAAAIGADAAEAAANTSDEFVATKDEARTVATVDTDEDWLELSGDAVCQFQTGDRGRVSASGSVPGGLAAGTDYFVIVAKHSDPAAIRLAASYADACAGTAVDITSAGSGTITFTKKAEPRYAISGVLEANETPATHLEDLLSGMGGTLTWTGGVWDMLAAAYVAPTAPDFTPDDLVEAISIRTRVSRRERFNAVRGIYVSPLNNDQPSDYPPVRSSTYRTADGGAERFVELDRPVTPRPQTAQRLGTVALNRHRRELEIDVVTNLKGLLVKVGDTITFTFERYGWDAKTFEVRRWGFEIRPDRDGNPVFTCSMSWRETDADVYAFDHASAEQQVAPAPRSTLPDAFTVAAPTTLAVTTETVRTAGNDELGYIVFSWATPDDFFVRQNGSFECQFKRSADAAWSESWSVEGDKTSTRIGPLQKSVNYDVRVRARNHLGVRSAWSNLTGFTLGADSSGATEQIDDGLHSQPPTLAVDDGGYATAVTNEFDDGSYT